jgi:hypothetical protein
MARIEGVPQDQTVPMLECSKKLTGGDPRARSGIEPMEIWAYQPEMMIGMGEFRPASCDEPRGEGCLEREGQARARLAATLSELAPSLRARTRLSHGRGAVRRASPEDKQQPKPRPIPLQSATLSVI